MKKLLKKYRVMSNRDDFPMTERHIHSLRIRDFASEKINFTEKEAVHFDVCRFCRFKVRNALRNRRPPYAEGCLSSGSLPLSWNSQNRFSEAVFEPHDVYRGCRCTDSSQRQPSHRSYHRCDSSTSEGPQRDRQF